MHYWQLHIGDWSKSCGHLTPSETGFYVRLLNVYYDTETPIPADLSSACRLVGARTPRERDEISGLMGEFFTLKDDGWHNKRADSEINRLHEIGEKRSNAAAKRWHTTSNANAMQVHITSNALQDSKTPRLQDTKKEQDQKHSRAPRSPTVSADRLVSEYGVDQQVAADWLTVRKAKKSPLTQTALDKLVGQFAAAGMTVPDGIRMCVERGWVGFNKDWLQDGVSHGTNQPSRLSAVDRVAAAAERAGFGERPTGRTFDSG